jgi:hypothetical protein
VKVGYLVKQRCSLALDAAEPEDADPVVSLLTGAFAWSLTGGNGRVVGERGLALVKVYDVLEGGERRRQLLEQLHELGTANDTRGLEVYE